LPFRAVNRRGDPGYQPGFQRHHLLPRQVLNERCFATMIGKVGMERVGFDDFRSNGLLLPCKGEAAMRMQLPLHRGPHRTYNAMVIARLGLIEQSWSHQRFRSPDMAIEQAVMRLRLLQGALRRRLLAGNHARMRLNRMDPLGAGLDFSDLDRMAELLWAETVGVAELVAT
jgi:hypothetical protein